MKKMTYTNSGVDILKEDEAITKIISSFKTKRKNKIGKPIGGHYAGMIEFGDNVLVLCTDGVGSKVLIANELNKYDTVGIDCIAMNVNDAICVGAEPLAFVDYLAINDPKPEITKEIGKGLEKGAALSNISIISGETATLPEIINGFDLAGTCLAYVKKDKIVMGENIKSGDLIIGLSSTGIHSNGYTLARRVIKENNFSYRETFPDNFYPGKTIGEIYLRPTQIYVKETVALLKKTDVHGIAHITGSGLRKLKRLNKNVNFIIDNPFEPQPIFKFIQKYGNIDEYEMYKTFNMGIGLVIIVSKEDANKSIKILKKYSLSDVKIVGRIEDGNGVLHEPLNLKF